MLVGCRTTVSRFSLRHFCGSITGLGVGIGGHCKVQVEQYDRHLGHTTSVVLVSMYSVSLCTVLQPKLRARSSQHVPVGLTL